MDKIWNIVQLTGNAIIMLGGAGAIVATIIRWLRKPDTDRDDKLKRHDDMLDSDNKRLKELEKEQEDMKEAQQVLMKAMLALMSHSIDGNHTDELKHARDEMQDFLLRR